MATRKPFLTPKARDEALQRLQEHFAQNHLELEDLEARTEEVERASSPDEVKAAFYGLPPLPSRAEGVALEKRPRVRPVVAGHTESLVAVLGAATRQGTFAAPPEVRAVAVLGSAVIDLSEARFEGVTEVQVRSVLGSVKVIVPAGVRVECHGTAVLGAFPAVERSSERGRETRVVRISGWVALGSVEVEVRARQGLLESLKGMLKL